MKKFIAFFGFLLLSIVMVAQEPVVDPTAPPASWLEILANPMLWLGSFAGIALLTSFVAAFFNGLLNISKSFLKQLCAWIVAIVLLVILDLINIGYVKDYPILLAIIHGFAAGLASNGIFDIPFMKSILDAIDGWFRPKP